MDELIAEIQREAAKIRSRKNRPLIRVKMNPADVDYLKAKYGLPPATGVEMLLGVPVVKDSSVPQGEPEGEYA